MRTFDEVKKSIKTIMSKGSKWQDDVQTIAVEALAHSVHHREPSLLCMLVDQLPKGAKASAMKAWLESEELVTVNTSNKQSVKWNKAVLDARGADAVEAMSAVIWYSCKPKPADPVYSTEALMKKLQAVVSYAKHGEEAGVAWGSDLIGLIGLIEAKIPADK